MCLMLYLGSDKERHISFWDRANPQFYVQKTNIQYTDEKQQINAIEQAKLNFSKQFIYYVGSHEGCGCGFRQDGFWLQVDEEIKKRAENHKNLFEYLSGCLEDENTIEIYACWAGSENESPQSKRTISVQEIVRDDFYFEEDEFIVVENKFDLGK
jgi:hypothetical protein